MTKRLCCMTIFCLLLLTAFCPPTAAADLPQTVRVGWFDQPSYQETLENGNRYGYTYEYYQEIADYTGWQYQFVEGSLDELYASLLAGEIDVMGCMYYSEQRAADCDLPDLNHGMAYSSLFVLNDSPVAAYDYAAFNGMRVAVRSGKNYDDLLAFAAANNFSITPVVCNDYTQVVRLVEEGDCDAGAVGAYKYRAETREVAKYSPTPFYFCITKGNQAVLDGFNLALNAIKTDNPYHDVNLAGKYDNTRAQSLTFTQEEKDYLAKAPSLRVLYSDAWMPLELKDSQSGGFAGLSADILQKIADSTGLQFEYIYVKNHKDMYPMLQAGKADIIACYLCDEQKGNQYLLKLSRPYISLPFTLVRDPSVDNNLTAVLYDFKHRARSGLNNYNYDYIWFSSNDECFNALADGRASQVLTNSYTANYYASQMRFAHIHQTELQGVYVDISLALRNTLSPELRSVINKVIANISETELNNILIRNTIDNQNTGLLDVLNRIPAYYILSAVLILLILLLVLLRLWRSQSKNSRIIENLLYYDKLVCIYNQYGFESRLRELLAKAEASYFIVSFKIPSFNMYNALYGFDAGDALLKIIADTISHNISEQECVARISGSNFVVCLTANDIDEVKTRIEKFDAYLGRQHNNSAIGLIYGIYQVTDPSIPANAMYNMAITAMRSIAEDYRDRIRVYDQQLYLQQKDDADLVSRMEDGLQKGEFITYYQAKFDSISQKIVGAEALVRWQHDDRLIVPGRFIDLFEKNGMIRKLDWYIMEQVCLMLSQRQLAGKPLLPVSINFSRVHIYDSDFAANLLKLTQKYQVPQEFIEIELTESAFMVDADLLLKRLDEIHALGFKLSIDDFGSGFSSLNMLKDLPVDVLKMDMRFLHGFESGGRAGTVLTSVMRMAKWLNLPVVAEGVETQEQFHFLRSIGCDIIQGYYFCRPLSREDFLARLESNVACPRNDAGPNVLLQADINALMGGNQLITTLLDTAFGGFGIYEYDTEEARLDVIRVNRGYYDIMGCLAEPLKQSAADIIGQLDEKDSKKFLDACLSAIKHQTPAKVVIPRRHKDGHMMTLDCLIRHLGGLPERPLLCIAFSDITEQVKNRHNEELHKYSSALYGIYDEIVEIDLAADTLTILRSRYNKSQAGPLAFSLAKSQWLEQIVDSSDRERISGFLAEEQLQNIELNTAVSAEYRIWVDGKLKWASSTLLNVAPNTFLLCNLDITMRKETEELAAGIEQLRRDAEMDKTTGIYNKGTCQTLIDKCLRQLEEPQFAALMIIDIDDFKLVNDTLGHLFGDAFLKEAADALIHIFRDQDIVGRYGGDEFIVLMNKVTDIESVKKKAAQIVDTLRQIKVPQLDGVKCSVGVTIIRRGNTNVLPALKRADTALYDAKGRGKDCFTLIEKDDGVPDFPAAALPLLRARELTTTGHGEFLLPHVFEMLYNAPDVEKALPDIIQYIGLYFDVSRVYIFENSDDDIYCSNTFEWCNEGITPEIDNLQNIAYGQDLGDNYHENFDANGIFYCRDIKTLPAAQRAILEPQNIKSTLQCAITENGAFKGYVGFDECHENRFWTKEQVDILVFIAELLSTFLLKYRSSQKALAFSQSLRRMLHESNSYIYVIDKQDYKIIYANKNVCAALGRDPAGEPCYKVAMGNDAPCAVCPVKELEKTGQPTLVDCFNPLQKMWFTAQACEIIWDNKPALIINSNDIGKYKTTEDI